VPGIPQLPMRPLAVQAPGVGLRSQIGVVFWSLVVAVAIGFFIVPLIGARSRSQLAESLGALRVALTSADLDRIEAALPPSAVAGTRYTEDQMRVLDSER